MTETIGLAMNDTRGRKAMDTADPFFYFDHAATTPMRLEAIEALMWHAAHDFGNPSSLHMFGARAKRVLDAARETIAATLDAQSSEVIFASSGSEANNLAVQGAARRMKRLGKGAHVIVSAIEHPSVFRTSIALRQSGFDVDVAPVDANGQVSLDGLRALMRSDTVLVTIMHANNVTGTIQPIREIATIAKTQGAVLHVDAVQTYGKLPVSFEELGADLMSISAHKIGGPKGVAALAVRRGHRLDAVLHGGGQERGWRPGTPGVPGIAAWTAAAEAYWQRRADELLEIEGLRARLLAGLKAAVPDCRVNGRPEECLPTHLNVSVPRIEGQALMLELDRRGFAVSSGSACSASDSEPSYVLVAMGQSRDEAIESLRITLGWTTTAASVDAFVAAFAAAVSDWRASRAVSR